jgi:hypothetical protein
MPGDLFKYIPFTVDQLTAGIEQGQIALPDIQRPFVWPMTKVRDLLDSMYQGFPVGQLMFWQTGADPGVRQIGTDEKPMSVPAHLIVDGQQRITSLYSVTTGKPVVRENYTSAPIRIAFNPFTERFAVPDATTAKQSDWLADITPLFTRFLSTTEGFIARLKQSRDVDEDERQRLFAVLDRVHDLGRYAFSVVELSAVADEEQVADVFVRINSEGVQLNQSDFILTLMSVHWEKGRQELEEFARASKAPSLSQASPFNWYLDPSPAQLLRVVVAVGFRRAVLKHAYSVLRGKDVDTGKADPVRRDAQFATLADAQAKVLDLTNWHEFWQCLERAGFRSGKMISSKNAILYSYALWLIGRVGYGVPLDRLREVIARWFFMAGLTSRYSGTVESQAEQDLKLFDGLAAGDVDGYCARLDRIVTDTLTNDFWTITLPNELATSSSSSPTLMAYIAALNILDADALLSTGKVRSRLDPAIIAKKGIERHHLFPRQYLRSALKVTDTKQINQIANMALVEWSDNIKISDDAPADYWPAQVAAKAAAAGLDDDRLARQRRWHALPNDWPDLDYDRFLEQRRGLMAAVVRDAFNLLTSPDYRASYPAPSSVPAKNATTKQRYFGISVKQLLDAGLLTEQMQLLPSRDEFDAVARILPDGRIELEGEIYDTPSGAGHAVREAPTNGWDFWVADTPDGPRTLADLRDELLTGS